jgi:uncharacterized cupredoxin-like copper-binding protein
MKHHAFPFLALSLLTLILVACGSSEPATTTTSEGTSAGNGTSTPQEVRVVMGEMYFKPTLTTFKVGQPYKFVLINEGKEPHEFTIAPPRKAGQGEKDEDAASLLDVDQLAGGQSRTLDVFTFKKPAPAGTLEFECSYPGHYEGGMHTPIIVEG